MAMMMGAGPMADALVIAIKIPSVLRHIFAEGAFNAAFVPTFAGILAKDGQQQARSYAQQILSLLVVVLAGVTIVFELFAPTIVPLVVSGFKNTPERMLYTIDYARLTFPFIFFISVCALYSGILNSLERFAAAAISPMMGNIAIIVTVYLVRSFVSNPGEAFSLGITACGFVQAAWVFYYAAKNGMGLRLRKPAISPEVRKFLLLLGPVALGSGVVQFNILLDMLIASYLPIGSVSYLEYADRLNQLPLSVIGTAVGTALLPLLSKQIRVNDMESAYRLQGLALEYALVLAIPATIGLSTLAFPIVQTVFEYGKLTPADTHQVALTLTAFSLGMPAYILIKIFSTIFFARQDTKTVIKVACGAVLLNLSLNLLLYKKFAHVGLAASTAISAWANALCLLTILQRRNDLRLSARFYGFLPRVATSATACYGVLLLLREKYWFILEQTKWAQIQMLAICIICGIVVYIMACFLTGIFKMSDLRLGMQSQK